MSLFKGMPYSFSLFRTSSLCIFRASPSLSLFMVFSFIKFIQGIHFPQVLGYSHSTIFLGHSSSLGYQTTQIYLVHHPSFSFLGHPSSWRFLIHSHSQSMFRPNNFLHFFRAYTFLGITQQTTTSFTVVGHPHPVVCFVQLHFLRFSSTTSFVGIGHPPLVEFVCGMTFL